MVMLAPTMRNNHIITTYFRLQILCYYVGRVFLCSRKDSWRADDMKNQTSFGALLRRYRMAAGFSQEALAARASLSTRAISDLERGINRTPHYDTLSLLIGALSLSSHQRALLHASARPELAPVT